MDRDEATRRVIIFTFCGVMVAVFGTLLIGLFIDKIDNGEIFKMIGHDFDLILVALTSYMGGRNSVKTP